MEEQSALLANESARADALVAALQVERSWSRRWCGGLQEQLRSSQGRIEELEKELEKQLRRSGDEREEHVQRCRQLQGENLELASRLQEMQTAMLQNTPQPDSSESQTMMAGSRAAGSEILDPSDPSCLVLPSLLQYLALEDILAWRLTSRQTRSPRVLIQHVTEMGRLDSPESILDFSAKWKAALADAPATFEELQKDVKQLKLFVCRWWCLRLANARLTHFPESDVRHIVTANLRDLLAHIRSKDKSLRGSAHRLLMNYAFGSLPFVQHLIADGLLGLMGDLLPESATTSKQASLLVQSCSRHLSGLVRGLTKRQRQKWASMLVRVLQGQIAVKSARIIDSLKILWRADDDPRRSYAEEEQQLRAFSKHASPDLQRELCNLRYL